MFLLHADMKVTEVLQLLGVSPDRDDHPYSFRWEARFHRFDGREQITIPGYKDGGIKPILEGSLKKLEGDVDVRLLLFERAVRLPAARTLPVPRLELPKDHLDLARVQGSDVGLVAVDLLRIPRDLGREVQEVHDLILLGHVTRREFGEVYPFVFVIGPMLL